jgi:hypothetical protein
MKCVDCGAENVPVYRSTPKGMPAEWKCEKCINPPKDVVEFAKIFTVGK